MENEWHETKKEFNINEKGEYIATHVTMEKRGSKILGFEKKDFWDQLIKSIGIVTIVIPLILFKCSRDADIDKQKNLMQLELFGNVLSDVQKIILLPDSSSEFKEAKHKIDIEYYSKMMMFGDDSIVLIYKQLKDTTDIYTLLMRSNNILDTILKHTKVIAYASVLPNRTDEYRDSMIKKRAASFQRSSKEWISYYYLLKSLTHEDSTKSCPWFDSVLIHLNISEPLIVQKTEVNHITVDDKQVIDSLIVGFNRQIIADKFQTTTMEENLKKKIEYYYRVMNKNMRQFNKILSKGT
jgi:hypothetical protein